MFNGIWKLTVAASVVLVVIACVPQARALFTQDVVPSGREALVKVEDWIKKTNTNTRYQQKTQDLNLRREALAADRLTAAANLAKVSGPIFTAMKADYDASFARQEAAIQIGEDELADVSKEKLKLLDKDEAEVLRQFADQKRQIVNGKAEALALHEEIMTKRATDSAREAVREEVARLKTQLSDLAVKLADLNAANDAIEEACRAKVYPVRVGKVTFPDSGSLEAARRGLQADIGGAKKEFAALKAQLEGPAVGSPPGPKKISPRDLIGP